MIISEFINFAAKLFNIKAADLAGPSRRQKFIIPRSALMAALHIRGNGIGRIGDWIGGRDHETARNNIHKAEALMESDDEYRYKVDTLVHVFMRNGKTYSPLQILSYLSKLTGRKPWVVRDTYSLQNHELSRIVHLAVFLLSAIGLEDEKIAVAFRRKNKEIEDIKKYFNVRWEDDALLLELLKRAKEQYGLE